MSQVGYTWVSIIVIFMNIALFSPPPVGLTSDDDVTEGFPLDLSVPSRELQVYVGQNL